MILVEETLAMKEQGRISEVMKVTFSSTFFSLRKTHSVKEDNLDTSLIKKKRRIPYTTRMWTILYIYETSSLTPPVQHHHPFSKFSVLG